MELTFAAWLASHSVGLLIIALGILALWAILSFSDF